MRKALWKDGCPLAYQLFMHHREMADESLLRRLLPVILPTIEAVKPSTIVKTKQVLLIVKKRTRHEDPYIPVEPAPVYPTMRKILEEVCAKYNLHPHAIMSKMRVAWMVQIRNEFLYRCTAETIQSYPQIAKFCGGRDHSTILYAVSSFCRENSLQHPRSPHGMDLDAKKRSADNATKMRRYHRLQKEMADLREEMNA